MKHIKHIIALSCLLLALSVPAHAIVSPFIRAGVDFSRLNAIDFVKDPTVKWQDKLKGWDVGYFGEVGIKFFGSHTLAAEIGYMKSTTSVDTTTPGTGGVESREQVPILLNYRNSFSVGPASLFLGVSAGMMSDRASWKQDIGSATPDWNTFKSGNWVGLYGVSAGLGFKFSKHWSLDLGVRALVVNGKEHTDTLPNTGKPYTIGKNEFYFRPDVRLALSLNW